YGIGGVAFHPHLPLLTCRRGGTEFAVIRYDLDALLTTKVPARRYRNAKVVLVGDTSVGKSGLALRLSDQEYRPTESTHNRKVASAAVEEVHTGDGGVETRETMLWDLAGQPGYRIVHQLHLAQSAVAVIVFDARSEADPIAGVTYWNRAIHNSGRLRSDSVADMPTLLVAARIDRGGVALPRQRIDDLVAEMRFLGYVETSAKQGWGIDKLRQMILDAIPWDRLPWSASTELFDRIKVFLWEEKTAGRVLTTPEDLLRGFVRQHPDFGAAENLRPSFLICVQLLEGRDVVRRLTFGSYILLRPEALDSYASALIDAARTEPDGMGFVPEPDALAGRFRMPGEERLPDPAEERILLIATVEELLRHDLVLREATDLVFPSQFTRDRPEAPERPRFDVVFTFEGAVNNIYAALAVRLSHIGLYHHTEMYRNTAAFTAKVGGVCGIALAEFGEGRAELGLFFTGPASEETRYLFEDYVQAHIQQRAIAESVERRRVFRCSDEACGFELSKDLVERWEQRGRTTGPCPACFDQEISLLDREDRLSAFATERVSSMNDRADHQRDLAVAETTIKGKAATNTFDVFISYRTGDRGEAQQIATQLLERGIRPWLDTREIAPGQRWQDVLEEQIASIKTVAVLIGANGLGPWQDLERKAFISEFMRRGCRVIPVLLATAGPDTTLPPLLAEWHAADFRTAQPDPVSQLIWGITGEFPQETL
ncbi:MAG: TIR domain-containing protein, partial [Actinoplanes sp.]